MRRMTSARGASPSGAGARREGDWRNMSYTNLAAMAEDNMASYNRMLPSSQLPIANSPEVQQNLETSYVQANEYINTGLALDENSPLEAIGYYQKGKDALVRALETAPRSERTEKMQRMLEMVEEHMQYITQRAHSESASDLQGLVAPDTGSVDADDLSVALSSGDVAFNLFDPSKSDKWPFELRAAQRLFREHRVFEDLYVSFGFQQSSVYNQQEHLLALLANTSRDNDGIGVLHRQLFANYRRWAQSLGEQAACASEQAIKLVKLTDCALFLLIWGEAANLRHVPECLCFLFHRMRQEHSDSNRRLPGERRPPGWYVSKVVAPLYRAMRDEMSKKTKQGQPAGHTVKCNYDDFNEFFWTPQCLQYNYFTPKDGDAAPQGLSSSNSDAVLETLGTGLTFFDPISHLPMHKRYVERRSWLAPIRSFWRIHAFLLQMLHVWLAFAFCQGRNGVFADGMLLQALCGVTLTHAATSTVQELLAVFIMHGMLHTHLDQLASLVLRLLYKGGFTAVIGLSYFEMISDAPFHRQLAVPPLVWVDSVLLEHRVFLYASICYAVPAALSAVAQVFPAISTWVRSWRGPAKAVLDLIEPLNRLFVGKAIHAPCDIKVHFDFFWLSLLIWKFTFSYAFQILPLVDPTFDVYSRDLSSWTPGLDLGKLPNYTVLFVRWAPIVLMYLLDVQIWYMLWVAFYGTWMGWSLHIGEVPDPDALRERLVAASEHFNLKLISKQVPLICAKEPPAKVLCPARPEGGGGPKPPAVELQEHLLEGSASTELGNESLRYFSKAWNAVIDDLRSGDLISNWEKRLMSFNEWEGAEFSRCTYLPAFCTAGKVAEGFLLMSSLAEQRRNQSYSKCLAIERQLQASLIADHHMREALTELCELARWLLSSLLGERHQASLRRAWAELEKTPYTGKVLELVNASKLPQLASATVALAKTLLSVKLQPASEASASAPAADSAAPSSKQLAADMNVTKMTGQLRAMLDALKGALTKGAKEAMRETEALKFTPNGFFWDEAYARAQLELLLLQTQTQNKLRGIVNLCSLARLDAQPTHIEVNRRLTWFVGTLFMKMPPPPPVARVKSWSTLTPFCNEDLLYSPKELAAKNEDGVTTLYFLKTVHPDEWLNFLERVGLKPDPAAEADLFKDQRLLVELRLWASLRGQTLVRTVDGMMQHERALRLQAEWEGLSGEQLEMTLVQKFNYVVSCQLYGQHKKDRNSKAADTEFLMQRYPNLRIAYIDKVTSIDSSKMLSDGRPGQMRNRFYSVLAKGAKIGSEEAVQQVYRVQLPGDIMLGEGKPENQNHAMIFTRGEAVQTIDMNQCGYFEEALKMRNLLQEFAEHPGSTIVGFREHIFTGELSSLASYMALQEASFVTLTQRILWDPLRVRLHYGHPDIFDKVFSLTNGGVSKASRGINLSEDVYAGFNHLLRGGVIPYAEYVQVGKGRDVGMQQIYKFEAKLASGNAEQCISRDVFRIGQRLDFSRLFSFYYSGPGFYFNNAATVFAMFSFLYLALFSHILDLDVSIPLADLLNAQWTLQLGLLLSIPIVSFMAVEYGLGRALTKFLNINLSGSLLFFMFHMGTKAYYFDSTLKYGGAKYRPTGRGFVMQHEEFAELFRFYAASHLYNGFELLWGLLLLYSLSDWTVGHYWRTVWSIWAVAFAWLFAPFWFNPLAFDLKKNLSDLRTWAQWMQRKDAAALSSWESWWREEHAYLDTDSWVKKMFTFLPSIRYALVFVGILSSLAGKETLASGFAKELPDFGALLAFSLAVVLLAMVMPRVLRDRPAALRMMNTLLLLFLLVSGPYIKMHVSFFRIFHFAVAAGFLFAALVRLPYTFGYTPSLCLFAAKAYDYLIGGLLLSMCLMLSATLCMKHVQNRALLSDAFNQVVVSSRLNKLLIEVSSKEAL